MTPLTILFGIYIAGSLYVIHALVANARAERKDLEDRLMALTQPEAFVLKRAIDDPDPGDVTYVDEAREFELNGKTLIDTLGED